MLNVDTVKFLHVGGSFVSSLYALKRIINIVLKRMNRCYSSKACDVRAFYVSPTIDIGVCILTLYLRVSPFHIVCSPVRTNVRVHTFLLNLTPRCATRWTFQAHIAKFIRFEWNHFSSEWKLKLPLDNAQQKQQWFHCTIHAYTTAYVWNATKNVRGLT